MAMFQVQEPLLAHVRKLRGFAREVMECRTGCLEANDISDLAIKHGLLEVIMVEEPCCENCECASLGEFPQNCYRPTPLLKGGV